MDPEQKKEREKNQKEFRAILEKYGLTQKQASELITAETGQSVGLRKVRTWLADPQIPSSRNCPAWALTALKRGTKQLKPVD
ncbi:conserved hypothetical protein [Candidatus Methylobacter favarea]|uniref:Uncharacterized protein n=1 Tax=Candidatus Methylobacter favarea TaxID=2707345 RepID=A0A8S0XTK8_9GAMM|nr:hypothetical protein [Candidatus Methylobacter favarea]CAA9891706.1 conserved hypothetical protein [Candidatus Methylobacter favarea]